MYVLIDSTQDNLLLISNDKSILSDTLIDQGIIEMEVILTNEEDITITFDITIWQICQVRKAYYELYGKVLHIHSYMENWTGINLYYKE